MENQPDKMKGTGTHGEGMELRTGNVDPDPGQSLPAQPQNTNIRRNQF